MTKKGKFSLNCSITKKEEVWEFFEIAPVRGGIGNQIQFTREVKNCLNLTCDVRGTRLCPFFEKYNN